jgi:glycosyltransferase involved in cell wall biosynthesis
VIRNGVDPDAIKPSTPNPALAAELGITGKRVIGFLGSFFEWEGLDLLIDAMAILRDSHEDAVMLLIGGGRVEAKLRRRVARLGLEDCVIMPGPVPRDKVPQLYGLFDVLVYPRPRLRLTEIVTPLKPLEAMAMGKAVVASDVGGHRELIEDGVTGLLFEAGSITHLVQTLRRVLDDDEMRRSLAGAGRKKIPEERSWDITTEPYDSVYRCVAPNAFVIATEKPC